MNKGLEALKKIKNLYKSYIDKIGLSANDIMGFDFSIVEIEKELKEGEKNKQALEIIKNKRVDCYAVVESKSLIDMNERFWFPSEEWKLAQEEYDLLKEVLL